MKELSVVVASINTRRTIRQCLETLVGQSQADDLEIVVVDASVDGSAEIARSFKQVRLVQASPGSLYPELWKMGIDLASGKALAFTTANFIPAANWVPELRAILQGKYAAIGGVFEKLAPDTLSQWAIYFLRYSAYLPSITAHAAPQLAADNAVYQHWVFEKYADQIQDGFWEHPVNRRLIADGYSMLLTPDLKVSMGYFCSSGEFFQQRFSHGRMFGAERVQKAGFSKRLLYILVSPLIPFILLARVTRNVLNSSASRKIFIFSIPWILFYILGWAFGELSGYLAGKPVEKKSRLEGSSSKL